MNNPSITLVMNPSSRSGRGRRNWPVFDDPSCRRLVTTGPDDLLRRVAADDAGTVVAVGGDGTINLVINAALRRSPPPRLGVLYSGTSPDFCRFHKIPVAPRAAWRTLRTGSPRAIDLCRVTAPGGASAWFASGCNLGFGPAVAARANHLRRYLGDFLGTLAALVWTRFTAKRFDAELVFDGGDRVPLRGLLHLAVLKNNFIASGIRVGIPAVPDDGFLHVVAVPRFTLADIFRVYRGGLSYGAFVRRARRVTISATPPQALEYDGDPSAFATPVTVECVQKVLEVIA